VSETPHFYVYVLFDWRGIPCYVGKGKGTRWLDHETRPDPHNPLKNNIVASTRKIIGEIPKIKVREFLSEKEAFALETTFINAIGRHDIGTGPLANMSDGGNGGNYGEAVRLAKAQWSAEKRAAIAASARKTTQQIWARLTAEEKIAWSAKMVSASITARRRLRENDPNYEIRRAASISAGHAKRTPEQVRAAVEKQLLSCPSEKRSEITKRWHASRSQAERSETVRRGWALMSPEERRRRVAGSWTHDQRSAQVRQQQASLTADQQVRRAQRAQNLGSNTRWINDGVTNKRLKQGNPIPDGWRYGRKARIAASTLDQPT